MKAVLQFRVSAALRSRVSAGAPSWLRIVCVDEMDELGLARELADAQVLLHVLEPVTARLLQMAPGLELVQKIGVGINTIDLSAAAQRGVRVANMPGTNSRAVCEATLALLLAVLRRIVPLDSATRRGEGWSLPPESTDDVGELAGRTVGLVGFGAVPRLLAPILQAFGARVQFCARKEVVGAPVAQVPWKVLLESSDVISLHVPLTEETRHLIDEAAFAAMRPGAVLINTARGQLVDESALCRALTMGKLRGAGLDVFDEEPTRPDSPLLGLRQVVVTPHRAWLTPETIDRSMAVVVENCARLREKRPLVNEIDLSAFAAAGPAGSRQGVS